MLFGFMQKLSWYFYLRARFISGTEISNERDFGLNIPLPTNFSTKIVRCALKNYPVHSLREEIND